MKKKNQEKDEEGGKTNNKGKDLVVDVNAKKTKKKPQCWWGASCYQKNPTHLKRYDHTAPSSSPTPDQPKPLTQEEKTKAKAIEEKELSGFFDLDYMGADSETEDEGQSCKWGFIASDNEDEEKKKSPSNSGKSSETVTLSVSKEEWEKFLQTSKQSGLDLPKFTAKEKSAKNKRKADNNGNDKRKKSKKAKINLFFFLRLSICLFPLKQ